MHTDICDALLGCPLDRVRVFDLETTGFSGRTDEILQVAITDGNGIELMDTYVRPTRATSWPDAERVHHITPAQVADAPTIDKIEDQIRTLLQGGALIVGYNMMFDGRFLVDKRVMPSPWPFVNGFDVMKEFAKVHGFARWADSGRYRWSKLAECAQFYGYAFDAHDAMQDTKAAAHCFRALLCDPKYYPTVLGSRSTCLSDLKTTQTKATRESIDALLADKEHARHERELRHGRISRGKYRGEGRFACFVGDSCVGNTDPSKTQRVLDFLHCESVDDAPESIPVAVTLTRNDSMLSCAFSLASGPSLHEVEALAERDRPPRMLAADGLPPMDEDAPFYQR